MWARALIALGVALFGEVLRRISRRLSSNEDDIKEVGKVVARVEATQVACQQATQERLAEGEENFQQFRDQVSALRESVSSLDATVGHFTSLNHQLSEQLKVLDARIYSQKKG